MIDFEEISDTFEEGFDKAKSFVKNNKVLVCAILGVGGFALYKAYTSKDDISEETYTTYGYVPTGYDGYPEMSASVSYDDVVEQLRGETTDLNNDFYNEIMGDVTKLVEDLTYTNEKYIEQIATSSRPVDYSISGSYLEEQRKAMEEQQKENILNQMYSNSEAWHDATSEEQERLHNENLILGSSLGLTFDSSSGSWFNSEGENVYTIKNKTQTSTSNLTSVGALDPVITSKEIVSQMQANSEAWHNASESEKERLHEENKRLGNVLGASFDSSTGTWSNSNGSVLYTVSSSSNKTTTSSGSKSSSSTLKYTPSNSNASSAIMYVGNKTSASSGSSSSSSKSSSSSSSSSSKSVSASQAKKAAERRKANMRAGLYR